MNLYLRYMNSLESVVDGVGVVGSSGRVKSQTVGVGCPVDPAHELALDVGLAELEFDAGEGVAQELLYILECVLAVDLGGGGRP